MLGCELWMKNFDSMLALSEGVHNPRQRWLTCFYKILHSRAR